MKLHPFRHVRALSIAAAAVGVLAGPVHACGDGWMGVNLVATPTVKQALRSAYVAAHPGIPAGKVAGPASGHTYYGSYSGTRYAVATFTTGAAAAYPTIFRTDGHGRWQVRLETHGGICTDVVPVDLIRVWWLQHQQGRCFVEPR